MDELIDKIKKILDGDVEQLNKFAEYIGKKYAPQNEVEKKEKLTTSQIRNILDDVQKMKKEDVTSGRYQLLRPKLAYVAGKNKKSKGLKEIRNILDISLIEIKNSWERFENFRNFFEAIVGYHKFYSKVSD